MKTAAVVPERMENNMAIIRGVICDQCGSMMYGTGNVSKERAAKYAREDGWTIGKRCVCPNCRGEKKKNENRAN